MTFVNFAILIVRTLGNSFPDTLVKAMVKAESVNSFNFQGRLDRFCSPNIFAIRSPKAIHLLPGEHGEILGRLGGGVGKSGMLEHKSNNISGMCKGRGKVIMEGLQELTNAHSNGTIPTPYGLLFRNNGGLQPPP